MDENLELEQEIDVDTEEITDVEEENEDAEDIEDLEDDPTDDDMLEYDEDGNVIESNQEADDEAAAQVEERETNETDINTPPGPEKPADDKNIKRETIIKDVLKAMGIETEDIDAGLIRLAADTKGVTPEQYGKELDNNIKTEAAQRMYQEMMAERMVAADMNDLHSLFPETKGITRFEDIPNVKRYAELRDLGLSVKEAYSAANPEGRREAVANAVKQQTINASKSHLKSNVPIASKDTSVKISRAEMDQMRELFPNMSDKELIALYKKTK